MIARSTRRGRVLLWLGVGTLGDSKEGLQALIG
jgi:hypothetical protein